MESKKTTILTLWGVAFLCVLAALYVLFDLPIEEKTCYGCPLCRASMASTRRFFIPVSSRIDESPFSRYYRNDIDPNHRHIWRACGHHLRTFRGCRTGCGSILAWRLRGDAAFAIARSLPDRRTRRAFCEQFNIPGDSKVSTRLYQRVALACLQLNEAYENNRARRDWPQILRKVHLYPHVP